MMVVCRAVRLMRLPPATATGRLGPHTLVSFVVWEQLKLLLHQMSSSEVLVEAVD